MSETVAATNGHRAGTKSAFILSQPAELTAAEVVEIAKKKSIKVAIHTVHSVRSAHRVKQRKAAKRPGSATRAAAPRDNAAALARLEEVFLGAALDIGMARAVMLLDEFRAQCSARLPGAR